MGRRNPDHQNQFRRKFSLNRLKSFHRRRRQSEQVAKLKAAPQGHRVVVMVPKLPKPSEHHISGEVVEAPPELQRFEGGHMDLDNPKKLTDAEIEHIRSVGNQRGWEVRYYDPDKYDADNPGPTGIQHEKSFPLEAKDALKRYLHREASGDVDSSVESSRKPRMSVQEVWIMPDGTPRRITIDASRLM